jgi:hypothetical protein
MRGWRALLLATWTALFFAQHSQHIAYIFFIPARASLTGRAIRAFTGTPPNFAESAYGAIQVADPQSKSRTFSFFLLFSILCRAWYS